MATETSELTLMNRAVECGGALALFFDDYSTAERALLEGMTHPERGLFDQTSPGVFRITDRGRQMWRSAPPDGAGARGAA